MVNVAARDCRRRPGWLQRSWALTTPSIETPTTPPTIPCSWAQHAARRHDCGDAGGGPPGLRAPCHALWCALACQVAGSKACVWVWLVCGLGLRVLPATATSNPHRLHPNKSTFFNPTLSQARPRRWLCWLRCACCVLRWTATPSWLLPSGQPRIQVSRGLGDILLPVIATAGPQHAACWWHGGL